jgi:hypothetical protein
VVPGPPENVSTHEKEKRKKDAREGEMPVYILREEEMGRKVDPDGHTARLGLDRNAQYRW